MIFMGNGEYSADACNDRHLKLKELFSDLSALQQARAGRSLHQEDLDTEWAGYTVKAQRFLERLQKDLLDTEGSTAPYWHSQDKLITLRKTFQMWRDNLQPKPDKYERWDSWDDMRHVVPDPPPSGRPYMDD